MSLVLRRNLGMKSYKESKQITPLTKHTIDAFDSVAAGRRTFSATIPLVSDVTNCLAVGSARCRVK